MNTLPRRRLYRRVCPMLVAVLLSVLSLCGCGGGAVPDPAPSVYYWRQELRLAPGERQWMERHGIAKLYVHLFDVVRHGQDGPQPDATLTVIDRPPHDVRVIPVVFLTHTLMADTTGLAALPRLVARRVSQMMARNDLGPLTELQIDFDWTRTNQDRYFAFLAALRQALLDLRLPTGPVRLSATIRLHQLGMAPPPVDYGALMAYNVGRLQDHDEPCSILRPELVKPYLHHITDYPLPLCSALPVYGWDILFHRGEFRAILRGIDVTDTTRFAPLPTTDGSVRYRATAYQAIPLTGVSTYAGGRIFPGDEVRHEWVTPATLHAVRGMIQRLRPDACRQVILYHLDQNQLTRYNDEDIQTLFDHP